MSAIVIDIDGVLAEFNAAMHSLLRSQGAAMIPFDGPDPEVWAWYELHGATKAQARDAWAFIEANPAFWNHLSRHRDFTASAESLLFELMMKHEVSFVTARPKGARQATLDWLEFWMGAWTKPQVVLTSENKAAALIAMQPDIVIEDRRETLRDYRVTNKEAHLILVNRAYNQGYDDGLIRVGSTFEALQAAQELAR